MKEINSIYNYIELQLDEANNKLDIEWEEGKAQEFILFLCIFNVLVHVFPTKTDEEKMS